MGVSPPKQWQEGGAWRGKEKEAEMHSRAECAQESLL